MPERADTIDARAAGKAAAELAASFGTLEEAERYRAFVDAFARKRDGKARADEK